MDFYKHFSTIYVYENVDKKEKRQADKKKGQGTLCKRQGVTEEGQGAIQRRQGVAPCYFAINETLVMHAVVKFLISRIPLIGLVTRLG